MPLRRALLPLLITCLPLLGCARSDAERLASVQAMIGSATTATIYRGIPHPVFESRGHAAAKSGETRVVPGGLAFPSPLLATREQQANLTEAIRSVHSVKRYEGPYKNGGFWPSYAIQWETAQGTVLLSLYGSSLLFEWDGRRLHLISENESANTVVATALRAIEDAETKRRINAIYGNTGESDR